MWLSLLFLLCLLFSIPLVVVMVSVLRPDWAVWQHLYETVLAEYIINSLVLMIGVGSLALLWGVIPAWYITMYQFPLSRLFEWALLLPFAIPGYIIAYAYAGMCGVGGPVQVGLRRISGLGPGEYWFPEVRSMGGGIILLSLVLYPYIYLLTRAAFIGQSVCVLNAARTLGCSALTACTRVALPLARPAMIAGLSLVLMEALADYGMMQYFGIPVLTTGIFRTWFGMGEASVAAQLSTLMIGFVLVLILLERWSRRQQSYHHTSHYYSEIHRPVLSGGKAVLAMVVCGFPLLMGFVLPFVYLSYLALQAYPLVVGEQFFQLLVHSLLLALIASLLALLLAVFIAYAHRSYSNGLSAFAVRFIGMGYAIPGTVIAIGVLIPFNWLDGQIGNFLDQYFSLHAGLLLSGSLFILIFAYLVRYLAVSLNTVEAGLAKVKMSMDETARLAGLSGFKISRRIHLPVIRGSLFAALLLVFVDVLKELPATLILRPFNFNTLAIRVYELSNEERLAEAAIPALAIMLIGIIPVVFLSRLIARSRPGH